jgi:hypothetical protein
VPTYGIGGGAFAGLALEVLPPPLITSPVTTAASGGTITAGTYRYLITSINANGESHGVADGGTATGGVFYERSITTTGSTSTVTLNWAAVPGATGYKIYKTAAGGASGSELLTATLGAVTTFVDTAPGTPTGAFPTVNTANNPNTYVPPTKFFPFTSDSINHTQATVWRRDIRQNVDPYQAVAGNVNTAGDFEFVATEDVIPWFLRCSRTTMTRTGTAPNYTYTFIPNASGISSTTMSLTIVKNSQVFAFVGIVVGSYSFTINDGLLSMRNSMVGSDEATQTAPIPAYTNVPAFSAGMYNFQIPTATQIFDVDAFEFSVDDGAEPQFRLQSGGARGARYIKYGARTARMSFDRDFPDKTEYDLYKALTSTTLQVQCLKTANNSVTFDMYNAVRDTFTVPTGSQGDLIRAHEELMAVFSFADSKSYQIACKTQELVF